MKSMTKILLAGAFAVTAIALSAAPSDAKGKKAAAKACTPGMSCVNKDGVRQACGGDRKWIAVLAPPCPAGANCGPKC